MSSGVEPPKAKANHQTSLNKMLPLKLVRSLVFGETINCSFTLTQNHSHMQEQHHHPSTDSDDLKTHDAYISSPHSGSQTTRRRSHSRTKTKAKPNSQKCTKSKAHGLLFLPTKEVITSTYKLASIARDIGMDLYPTPSLSHIIFHNPLSTSWPSPSSTSRSTPSSSFPSSWSWSSSSSSWPSIDDAVPIPFPSLTIASLTHLRCFVALSKGLFKLVFFNSCYDIRDEESVGSDSNWNCCSVSLHSRITGDRISTMDDFSMALAGKGWTFYKTKRDPSVDNGNRTSLGGNSVYLFRKVDSNRVRLLPGNGSGDAGGGCRIRELRLPPLDFRNSPLRILQYILLMTDDIFYLA